MRVVWIKPMFGFAVTPIMGGANQVAADLERMGAEIGGTSDCVAVYVTLDAPEQIGWRDYRGCIAGVARLRELAAGQSVRDFPATGIPGFEERWPIGWPVAEWLKYPSTNLQLKMITERHVGKSEWRRMHTTFQGGRPVRVADDPYRPLADWLTNQMQRMQSRLTRLNPQA